MSNFDKVKNNAVKIGKYKKKKKRIQQGWARNVLRSLGYSAQDVISELMPNTADTVDSAKNIRDELAEAAGIAKTKANEGYTKVKQRIQQFNEKELKEALEDLKSGKIYNKERMDAANSFDFGDDFGDSFGSFDEDFDSFGTDVHVTSNNPETNVAVSLNVGEDSPIISSQDATTAAVTAGFNVSNRMSSEHMSLISTSIATMSSAVTSELKLLTSEMNKLTSTLPETITSQAALRTDFFEKSLAYQERMSNALDIISKSYNVSGKLAGLGKDEHFSSKLDDKVYMGLGDYAETVKKQLKGAIDDSALGMMYNMRKMMKETEDEMGGFNDNKPLLAKGLNAVMKAMMPNELKKSGEKLDNFFSNIFLPIGMKMNKWKGDWDNPIKQFLGKVFGISTSGRTQGDKKEYEKGAVAFDGKVHRAITDVIPTLLSKIYSAVSGHEEVMFDYENGVYNTVSQMRENYKKTMRDEATMPYVSSKISYNNAVSQLDIDDKQKQNLQKVFEDFLYNMTMSGGNVSWRKNGDKDDIARLTELSSDDPQVKFIRQYFETMYDKGMHDELNQMFSSNMVRARANLDKKYKDMSKDGTINNYNLIDNGFDPDGENKMKVSKTGNSLASDKYGNSSMYYLREILETLNTGIRVTVVNKDSEALDAINNRRGVVSTNLKSHIDALNASTINNMGGSDADIDESSGGFNAENINSALNNAIRTYDEDKTDERLEKVQNKFGNDHAIGKFIGGIRNFRNKGNDAIKKFTNSITGFVTDLIYGAPPKKNGNAGDGVVDPNTGEVSENVKNSLAGTFQEKLKGFGDSIHNVVIKPLKDALFDKENGLITQMADTAMRWKESFKTKVIGKKNSDGFYEGGYFSAVANAPKNLKDKANSLKNMLLNGDPAGNEPAVIKAIREAIGTDDNGKIDFKGKGNGIIADLRKHISDRAHEWTDNIFGPSEEGEPDKLDTFLGDMSKGKGAIGITTSIGLLSSFFLPFGPVGGALIGLATGIAGNSSQFKNVIFGEEGADGKRLGGIISKEWQDKFSDSKDAIAKGAGVGILGSMFLPGGPIMGAIVGAGLGLAAKTDAFADILYGNGGTEKDPTGGLAKYVKDHYGKDKTISDAAVDTGIGAGVGIIGSMFLPGGPILGAIVGGGLAIARKTELFSDIMYGEGGTKDDPTGGITKIIKDHWNSDKVADDAFMDAGIGAGVGLIGSFFLPGGPIMGALIGAGASLAINSESFQDYIFGKKGEDGKRTGGLLTNASEKITDFMFDQTSKLSLWMEQNVVNPLKVSIEPIKERFVNFFDEKKDSVKSFIFGEKDEEGTREGGLLGAIADRVDRSCFGELKRTIKEEVVDKIKDGFRKFFDGFFNAIGSIIKAPFKAIADYASESEDKNMAKLANRLNNTDTNGMTEEELKKYRRDSSRLTFYEGGYNVKSNLEAMNKEAEEKAKKRKEEREKAKEEKRKKKRTPEQVVAENSEEQKDVAKQQLDKQSEQLEETKSSNTTIKSLLGDILSALTTLTGGGKKDSPAPIAEPTDEKQSMADLARSIRSTDISKLSGEARKKYEQDVLKLRAYKQKNKKGKGKDGASSVVTDPSKMQDIANEEAANANADNAGNAEGTGSRTGKVCGFSINPNIRAKINRAKEAWNNRGNKSSSTVANPLSGSSANAGNISDNVPDLIGTGSDAPSLLGDNSNSVPKNIAKIKKAVDGQLNGVGNNVYRIYKLLKRRLGKGEDDDDIDGADAKAYQSLPKRILNKLLAPFKVAKDVILAPFKVVANVGKSMLEAGKSLVGGVIGAGKALVNGVLDAGKAVLALPASLIKGAAKALPSLIKGAGDFIGGAASFIGSAAKSFGHVLENAASGFGEAVGNAISGFTGLVAGAFKGAGELLHGIGIAGKEVLKFGAKGIGLGVKGIAWAGSKIGSGISGLFGGKGGKGKNKRMDVYVVGGHLDKVVVVERIGKKKDKKGKSKDKDESSGGLIDALTGNTDDKSSDNPVSGIVSTLTDAITGDDGEPIVGKGGKGGKGSKKKSGLLDFIKNHKKDKDSSDKPSISNDNKKTIGKTAADMVAQRLRERENEERKSMFKKLLETLKTGNDQNKEHHSIWNSIFSKKGIITMGLLIAAPLIIDFFKEFNLETLVSSIWDGIKTGFKEIGGFKGLFNNIGETAQHVANTINGTETRQKIEDGKLVYDENGEPVYETVKRSRAGIALMENKQRIDPETGEWKNVQEWDEMSGHTARFAAHTVLKGYKKGLKFADKAAGIAARLGGASKDEAKNIISNKSVYETAKSAGTKVKSLGTNVVNGAKNFVQNGRAFNELAGEFGVDEAKQAANITDIAAGKAVKAYDTVKGAATGWLQSGRDLNALQKSGSAFADAAGTSQKLAGKVTGTLDAVSSKAAKVADTVTDVAESGKGIISTFVKKVKDAFEFIIDKLCALGEKFGGKKLQSSKFGKVLGQIYDALDEKILQKFAPKIKEFFKNLTFKAAGAVVDWVFIGYGALNGAVNAAATFEVPKDAVDGKMRAISAVFQGILASNLASLVDFVCGIVYDISGFSPIKSLATWAYSFLASDEEEAALQAAQQDFTQGYEDYVQSEYDAYVQSQQEQGMEAMSLEDWKASGNATSRSDYNADQNKSLVKRGVDFVKGGIDKVKDSKVGKAVGGVVKGVGSAVGGVAKGIGTGVSTVASGIGNGVSAVWNKGKEVFGTVGSAIGNGVSDGIEAAKGIATGMVQIVQNYQNKDNSFLDYMQADVNTVSEENSFHGLVGGILGIAKVVMLPKLIVAGVMAKVGKAVIGGVKAIFTGAVNAFKDYATNAANIDVLALKGDIQGLSEYQMTTSDDNPIGGIISAIGGIQRITAYPVAGISWVAQKIVGGIKTLIANAKTIFSDYIHNTGNINALALKGDIQGLSEYQITASEDNPIGGITSALGGIQRFAAYPVAGISWVAQKIKGFIGGVIDGAKVAFSDYIQNAASITAIALKGDFQGLSEYQVTTSEDNPIGGIISAIGGIQRITAYPVAGISWVAQKIKGFIGGVIDGAKTAFADVMTNSASITAIALKGDFQSLSEYQVTASDDNPISGITSAIGGIQRITAYPVAGISWVAQKIKGFISGVIEKAKIAFSDVMTNSASITAIALKGDFQSLSEYQVSASEDNPIGGITSAIGGIQRIAAYPVAGISWIGQKIKGFISGVVSGAKTAFSDGLANSANITALAMAGDIQGLSELEITVSDDNPVGGIVSAIGGIQRVIAYPIAGVSWAGHKIAEGISSIVSKVVGGVKSIGSTMSDIGSLALAGDVQGLKDYSATDDEGNDVGGFTGIIASIGKFVMTPVANVIGGIKNIISYFKGNEEEGKESLGTKVKNFVSKLNEYTDPDKDVSGWENEAMGEGGVADGLIGTIIKKVMWIYVNIVRGIKGIGSFLGDAKDWIVDKVNDAGTAAMNLGRGGKGGGKGEGTSSSGVENDFPYYSQNDPSIKNKEYKLSSGESDTMGNRGCGPVAMSMVASGLTGHDVDPTSMASYATDRGYNLEGGTMPGYFGDAASSLGISSQVARPTADNISGMLGSGKPVILQGQNSSGNSPYTSEGHYVVGVGMKNGNVLINDPRGKSYSGEYSMDEVTSGAQNLWGFSGGMGGGLVNVGGKGESTDTDMANGFPFLLQGDSRWGSVPYTITGDSSQTIKTSACGPTSMAMVARSFGYPVTPVDTINYSLEHGYRTKNSGTSWGFFNDIAENKYGLTAKQYGHAQAAISDLQAGKPVIASMGPSTFTSGGHYIVLSGMTEDGQILVNDPGSSNRTYATWDPSIFAKEGKQFWSFADSKTNKGSINNIKYAGDINLAEMSDTSGSSTLETGAPGGKQNTGNEQADTSTDAEEKSPFTILSDLAGIFTDAGKVFFEKLFGKSTSSSSSSSGLTNLASSAASTVSQVGNIVNSADNIEGSDTAEKAWNYFTGMGYSKEATAGILGNLEAESGLNSKTIQNNGKGPAAGLAQWENYNTQSGRWAGLRDYATSKGKDWTDEGSQLEFINTELTKLGEGYWKCKDNMDKAGATPTTFDQWRASSDVDMATRQFEGAFERAGKLNMDKRVNAAKKYYDLYSNKSNTSSKLASLASSAASTASQAGNVASSGVNAPAVLAGMGGKPDKTESQLSLVTGGKGTRNVSDTQVTDWLDKADKARSLSDKAAKAESSVTSQAVDMIVQVVQYLKDIAESSRGTRDGVNALNNKDFGGSAVQGGNTTNNLHTNVNTQSQNKTQDPKYYNTAKELAKGMYKLA